MPKESSTLSVLFPCAAAISPDHGKQLTTAGPARALPVGNATSWGFTLPAFAPYLIGESADQSYKNSI